MRLSDWVHTCHNMNKITGFVIGFADDQILINVTIPKDYGVIAVNQKDVLPADDTIWLDDIPSLIDLALMIRDREWFQKWVRELSMWMSVEELNHQG